MGINMRDKMKKIWTILLAAIVLNLVGVELFAQSFINNGTYNATCGGVIKLKSTNATITGTANLGQSAANSIPGVVDWASTAANQVVQPYYYQRLVVSGGSKVMQDGIRVIGEACATLWQDTLSFHLSFLLNCFIAKLWNWYILLCCNRWFTEYLSYNRSILYY
jgi:hypothetical protein